MNRRIGETTSNSKKEMNDIAARIESSESSDRRDEKIDMAKTRMERAVETGKSMKVMRQVGDFIKDMKDQAAKEKVDAAADEAAKKTEDAATESAKKVENTEAKNSKKTEESAEKASKETKKAGKDAK